MNAKYILFISVLIVLVTGCSHPELHDLEAFVEETRTSQRGRVDPLPQFKPFETYQYAAVDLRDPFRPWHDDDFEDNLPNGNILGPKPDFERRKELLEKYPLDALKMVGTLSKDGQDWAIISAPDSMVYRVKEGNYLGQNHGKIILLAEERIALTELVPDGLGGWLEREAFLTLESEDE